MHIKCTYTTFNIQGALRVNWLKFHNLQVIDSYKWRKELSADCLIYANFQLLYCTLIEDERFLSFVNTDK